MKLTRTTFFLGCLVGGLGAAALPLLVQFLSQPAQAETKLLPFQGRLTDAAGNAIGDGARVVEFKMYDAPTGGNVKWAGEVHKLSINGGLVNTMLGSKAGLGSEDFATATFLRITVDANGDDSITAVDPPLLPRQSVVSAVYANEAVNARDSVKLAGADWTSIMVDGTGAATNVPGTGFVKGAKIQAEGITGVQLAGDAVDASKIANGAVGESEIANDAVTSDEIANETIQVADLAPDLQNSVTPPGVVVSYAAAAAPTGWTLCDGRAVSRTDPLYAGLCAVIGVTHGAGDGTTTFNLPDYRGRFLRGVDDPDGTGGLEAAGRDPDAAGRIAMATGGNVAGNVGSVQGDAFHNPRVSCASPMGSALHGCL
ncbi:MAG: tail fiber protein [Verrucomicrobiales bacterium]|nr:tail fiber protein [Verrucomicrobiales bacterium]